MAAASERLASPENAAAIRRDEASQRFKQRALASAIRADEGDAAAAFRGETNVIKREHLAVGDTEVRYLESMVMRRCIASTTPANMAVGVGMATGVGD